MGDQGSDIDLNATNRDTGHLTGRQITLARVDELRLGLSPRFGSEDDDHARVLAENLTSLPPILIQGDQKVVIDGAHRLLAAKLRGLTQVPVQVFAGSVEDAVAESIRRNVRHGKPLSMAERCAAAQRLCERCPEWSDRKIAEICGVSPKRVAALRDTKGRGSDEGPERRTGRDGKTRPTDPAAIRRRIAEYLAEAPHATLRQVSSAVGASQATVLDVKRRLAQGLDPVPRGLQPSQSTGVEHPPSETPDVAVEAPLSLGPDPEHLKLKDWLCDHAVEDNQFDVWLPVVPTGRLYEVADLAKGAAACWARFAQALEQRARIASRR